MVLAAWALGIDIALPHFLVFVPIILFVQLLPISVAGLGTREAAFVYFFGSVGVGAESAFALSLLFFAGTILSAVPGAFDIPEALRRPSRVASRR